MMRRTSEKIEVRDLKADQKRNRERRLETLLLERLNSANDSTFSMDDVRTEVRRRVEAKQSRLL